MKRKQMANMQSTSQERPSADIMQMRVVPPFKIPLAEEFLTCRKGNAFGLKFRIIVMKVQKIHSQYLRQV